MNEDLKYMNTALRGRLGREMVAREQALNDLERLQEYLNRDQSFRLQDVDRCSGAFGLTIHELLNLN